MRPRKPVRPESESDRNTRCETLQPERDGVLHRVAHARWSGNVARDIVGEVAQRDHLDWRELIRIGPRRRQF